jgi:excisionase family DNA binding protein
MSDELLDVEDLCRWLKVDRDWVYDHVQNGDLPYVRLGGRPGYPGRLLRFERAAIQEYLFDRTFVPQQLVDRPTPTPTPTPPPPPEPRRKSRSVLPTPILAPRPTARFVPAAATKDGYTEGGYTTEEYRRRFPIDRDEARRRFPELCGTESKWVDCPGGLVSDYPEVPTDHINYEFMGVVLKDRGLCVSCNKSVKVRKDGKLSKHNLL